MSSPVYHSRIGDLLVIRLNHPPVNALSQPVREALLSAFTKAEHDTDVKAVVLYCEGRTFIAGADIKEFGKPPQAPLLPDLIRSIENSSKPSVAVIHGSALGGGLEVALGCHYRLAHRDARLGLPEVKLGLLPGAGGTQRLPRVAGVAKALEMVLSGEPIGAPEALESGILDGLFEDDPQAAGIAYAKALLAKGGQPRRSSERRAHLENHTDTQALIAAARDDIARRLPDHFAPPRCLEAIEAAITLPMDEGLKRERELFLACLNSPQRAALVEKFFAERRARKQTQS